MTFHLVRNPDSLQINVRLFYTYIPYAVCPTFIDCLGAIEDVCSAYKAKAIIHDPQGANPKMTIKYNHSKEMSLYLRKPYCLYNCEFLESNRAQKCLIFLYNIIPSILKSIHNETANFIFRVMFNSRSKSYSM